MFCISRDLRNKLDYFLLLFKWSNDSAETVQKQNKASLNIGTVQSLAGVFPVSSGSNWMALFPHTLCLMLQFLK